MSLTKKKSDYRKRKRQREREREREILSNQRYRG